MTDQVRREEVAESELLDTLLDAADAPAAQANATSPDESPAQEAEVQPTPETEAQGPVAEAETTPVAAPEADVTGETPAAGEPAEAEADVATPEAAVTPITAEEASAEGEAAGASFTPVAEEGGRPRRMKDLQAGMELEGRVTSIALYGIFVDIGVGRDGLVHISEMSDTRIDTPSDLVQIGDTVKVRVKGIDPEARRISLTMRSQERSEGGRSRGRPKRAEVDKDRISSLKVGDVVEGAITGFAPFGAFADIGVGKDGLIHVSELAEGRVEKPEDAVKVGDKFNFKVLEIDPEGTRISLSLRRAMRTQRMQGLEPGQVLEGTVSGLAQFGAFVDIGVGRDGLVHISALSPNRVAKVEDVVKVGDKVTVKVIEVDQQSKRISLTMRLEDPEPTAVSEDDLPSAVIPRTGPGAAPRFAAAAAAAREGQQRGRGDRNRRGPAQPVVPETYSTEDEQEEFVGDATLEDLLSKYGSQSSNRRDRKKSGRTETEVEEEGEVRGNRRQRDAIRRTLQQVGRDE